MRRIISLLKKRISSLVIRIIQTYQKIINTLSSFSFNMDIRFCSLCAMRSWHCRKEIKMALSLCALITAIDSSNEGPFKIIKTGVRWILVRFFYHAVKMALHARCYWWYETVQSDCHRRNPTPWPADNICCTFSINSWSSHPDTPTWWRH